MVKGKEQEIPEAFRQIIKDQESEKQVKEMFEKAYGLEHVKADRSKVSEDFRSYKSQAEPIMQIAKQLDHFYSKGDLTSYFKTLGIRKEEVFNWAVQQAEIENLPENQKAVYHQQQESEARAYQLEQQLQQREMEYQQFKVQHRENELNTVLSTPEISQAVQAFNQRNGEGAFWNEVVARGQWYWHAQGRDVPATEIVNELMTKYGLNQPAPVAHQAMQAQTQQMNQPGTQSSPKQVPVIPNTGPGSASPAQRAVKSTADLQKIYAEKYGPR